MLHMEDIMDPVLESKIDQKMHSKSRSKPKDGFKWRKTINEVLDKPTVMTLYGMISGGTISGVDGAVGAGKESLLFLGRNPNGQNVALKVYLVSTSNFKKRISYIQGDPRFSRFRKNTRNLVYLWAQKEFRNLTQAHQAGVRVPRPIKSSNNVLAMEFVGEDGLPAPLLLDSVPDEEDYAQAMGTIKMLYKKAKLVHGDYSEYNIFKTAGGLISFDLGSAVDLRHPASKQFLQRDINNINRYFTRRGIPVRDTARVMEDIL